MRLTLSGICIALLIIVIMALLIFKERQSSSESMRRSVPYAKREPIMSTLVEIISKAATESQTHPFLLYGTLLGYVRNKGFICYDFDVDMGVKSKEYGLLFEAVAKVINSYPGYRIDVRSFLGWRQFVVVHIETGINCDVSEFIRHCGKYRRNVPSWYSKYFLNESRVSYPLDWIDNLRIADLNVQSIYIPNKPELLLKTYYGPKFLTPDHICDESCNECVKIP